jgi:thiosulfate/3-mercaptopyruvate sulfurtransferase
MAGGGYANAHLLVTPAALQDSVGSDGLDGPSGPLLIDLRPAEEFARGALPGAVHLDLYGVSLIDTDPAPMRAFLWIIEHQLATRGVCAERRVVVYDEHSGIRAARALWFLELFGHPDVALLDGGYGAWLRAGLPVSRDFITPVPTEWHGSRREEILATWRDVHGRLGKEGVVLVDTRTPEEHYGTLVRAARGGTIPGSVHLEWTHNLSPNGCFKPADELRAMYAGLGVTSECDVVAYCQGGYRGAHTYLALRLLGFPQVRNYLGSWREWGDRLDLPLDVPTPPAPSASSQGT